MTRLELKDDEVTFIIQALDDKALVLKRLAHRTQTKAIAERIARRSVVFSKLSCKLGAR